ncbi:hypothetical protein BHU72_13855 [Desulfuribacillus stibiiarsenatis]|uniref:Uncharacterized protein n=1 Tax=Desulfuribacillus stibiiarsenatis TaxID=1390249 RepID=A0A1E5L835_9FIRM|nr:hypothetical protein BHU72_13855 [Desulfuribacillus stibiiarsenatis]
MQNQPTYDIKRINRIRQGYDKESKKRSITESGQTAEIAYMLKFLKMHLGAVQNDSATGKPVIRLSDAKDFA